MKLSAISVIPLTFFFVSVLHRPSNCQQQYIGAAVTNCSSASLSSNGYLCNDNPQSQCQSFMSFRSIPPYDTPSSIANLLDSDPSSIASSNNFTSIGETIPSNHLVIVPVSCSCSGSIYQHSATYTVTRGDYYFRIANSTYQGLTTCKAILGQNYYDPEDIPIGVRLVVPLRCACPSTNQTQSGFSVLLTYIVAQDETIEEIGPRFGVSKETIMKANMLSNHSMIYPLNPILIPLKLEDCRESPGSFYCSCPDGYLRVSGLGHFLCIRVPGKKFPIKLVVSIGASIGFGCLCLFVSAYLLYRYLKKQRSNNIKKKLFEQNGGFLLQQKLASFRSGEKARIFTREELERATDNYSKSRFLGQGGYGTVYKGMLEDGTIVAVKKSKAIDRERIDQFVNEVVILSQINHRNIVKLLGCCLETKVPTLVYEYIPNGTLSQHIHQDRNFSLPWEDRLRVACEVAGAVAYMHSSASVPIFHRDIKPSNILLDEKLASKVSDFGTSRSVPYDKTHITTAVQGTFGYLDPEYFQSSQFTDRSDVYSFGVVLVELLTGEGPVSFARGEDERNRVANFMTMVREDRLGETLDHRVANEARKEDVKAVAMLAMRCLRLNRKKRPTMKEVAMELGLRNSQSLLQINQEVRSMRDEPFQHCDEIHQEILDSTSFSLYTESGSIPR
ncbi:wall-associated receptor kinase-like 9 [Punica granatum]|uniref:Uncharacterized protein n=2 Tax=Punica granatum TaxID=22663 RepID=A0A2I0JGX9_PUNGR|nr:wall-associated receptor kinase-like 9 [Punica granatum]PKI55507.1 hypothetical protein CRG98_024119 [Punica granatum]